MEADLVGAEFQHFESVSETFEEGENIVTKVSGPEDESHRSGPARSLFAAVIKESSVVDDEGGQQEPNNSVESRLRVRHPVRAGVVNTVGHHSEFSKRFIDMMKGLERSGASGAVIVTSNSRSVKSPALSVDTGSPSGGSLANGISRLLNVEQGHYADIYNRIDENKPLSTKRPVEIIEDNLRRAVGF